MASHVLVALDGSPLAEAALDHALETYDCYVTVLNVVTPIDESMSESGVLDRDGRLDEARQRAGDLVEQARQRTGERERDVETVVETGDPAETILDYAETNDVDHVVIGGHGGELTGLARRLLGTVATAVVSEATVTVTVVR